MFKKIITLLVLLVASPRTSGFTIHSRSLPSSSHLYSAAPSDVASDSDPLPMESMDNPERDEIKRKLLLLCASYDRGFGASKKARDQVDDLIQQLELANPTPVDASRGVDGNGSSTPDEGPPPLEGIWRMVWTTALDVLSLAASPIATPGAIYQVIEPPIATNIIDFIPRAQNLLPSAFPTSLIRAEVKTRASIRPDNSNRVGLNFEAVKVVPVEVLGMKADFLPPLSINLPGSQIKIEDLPGVDPATAPGYFDVVYLDNDVLVIRQNAPGGYFVSVKVDDCDP
eukprot:CAMPEP_0197241574 /NCGR_PEP_ID=MMETSP1429-20130617/7572_1 /TAXON_ID=49237 /ORGANISM="Chaetoceros  sp., Strain UNC1202" /LENGTH=283 /DNA_ID=CAMNT_0042701431 /DNA_START=61 /DNA_END=912 /DNA_ORIENTATION=+